MRVKTGKAARDKGIRFELEIIDRLKELGFTAISTRSESRNLDNLGLDIIDSTPFSIQNKAVERLSLPCSELLKQMGSNGLENPVIAHKRAHKGTTVTMTWELFEKVLKGEI